MQISRLFKYKKSALALFLVLVAVGFFIDEKNKIIASPSAGVIDHLDYHECGVVLTGSAGRIREGFEVLAQKKIGKLIVSGVYKDTKLHEIFPLLPYYPEINPGDIVLEKISGSTLTNAIQSRQVVETLKCRNVLLITSQLHMYRALRTFRLKFPTDIPIADFAVVNHAKENSAFDVFIETVKSLWYSLLYLFPVLFDV